MGNSITINGVRIEVQGSASNISIRNGNLTIGGSVVKTGLSGQVQVVWDGPLASLDCDGNADTGNVSGNVSAGNGVKVSGDVGGSVSAGNSVTCQKVGGSIQAGGSVKVG
jgi:hypothetical protein